MKIEKFFESMLPSISKSTLKEELRNLADEVNHKSIPPYVNATELFNKRYKFKSRVLKDVQRRFDAKVDGRHENYILAVNDALKNASKNIVLLHKLVDEHYDSVAVREGMTYLKVNIAQYIESIAFLSVFSRRLLLATYGFEGLGETAAGKHLSKDMEFVNKRLTDFMIVVNANLKTQRQLEKSFDGIPDIKVDPETAPIIRQQVGLDKVDPNKFGFISSALNPFYHLGMLVARYQVHRIRLAEEEMELLNLKLAHLKNESMGKKDPKLEEVIERYTARVSKLQYELEEMKDV